MAKHPVRRRLRREQPVMISLINANSPLVWTRPCSAPLKVYARRTRRHRHAVHPRRRDVARSRRWRHLTQTLAEALGRHRLHPARPPGRAGGLGSRSPPRCRCSRARRPSARRSRRSCSTDGRARAPARRAVPLRRERSARPSCPTPRRPTRAAADAAADRAGRRQLRAARGRLAGGRAGRRATRSSSSTPTSSA
jgi:hypothetical protein